MHHVPIVVANILGKLALGLGEGPARSNEHIGAIQPVDAAATAQPLMVCKIVPSVALGTLHTKTSPRRWRLYPPFIRHGPDIVGVLATGVNPCETPAVTVYCK